jgi:hypothetical protein
MDLTQSWTYLISSPNERFVVAKMAWAADGASLQEAL